LPKSNRKWYGSGIGRGLPVLAPHYKGMGGGAPGRLPGRYIYRAEGGPLKAAHPFPPGIGRPTGDRRSGPYELAAGNGLEACRGWHLAQKKTRANQISDRARGGPPSCELPEVFSAISGGGVFKGGGNCGGGGRPRQKPNPPKPGGAGGAKGMSFAFRSSGFGGGGGPAGSTRPEGWVLKMGKSG